MDIRGILDVGSKPRRGCEESLVMDTVYFVSSGFKDNSETKFEDALLNKGVDGLS